MKHAPRPPGVRVAALWGQSPKVKLTPECAGYACDEPFRGCDGPAPPQRSSASAAISSAAMLG